MPFAVHRRTTRSVALGCQIKDRRLIAGVPDADVHPGEVLAHPGTGQRYRIVRVTPLVLQGRCSNCMPPPDGTTKAALARRVGCDATVRTPP
jgi:hypothetical protein